MMEVGGASSGTHARKKARFTQLAFMIYGASCGGAFGVEEMISGSGPGVAFWTLIIVPFLFCVPIAMAVGELTAAMPVEGGSYRWSRVAFGDFWGFQAGYWTWMTGVMTNVIFAQLFVRYLSQWLPLSGVGAWLACLALIWSTHLLNVRGINVVGNASIVLTLFILFVFLAMFVLGLRGWSHSPLSPFAAPKQSLLDSVSVSLPLAIFLYAGYDKLSNVADEVEAPQRNFPRALFVAVSMAAATYILPTFAALAALGNWTEWKEAYFPVAAMRMGGAPLFHAMTLAGMASNAMLLAVTVLAVSRVPLALAEDGFLPGSLSRLHPVRRTPVRSLLYGSIAYSLLSILDFRNVLVINVWFQMASNILIYADVWRLRSSQPDAPRPFVIPFGRPGLVVATATSCLLALVCMVGSVVEGGALRWTQLALGVGALASGAALYRTMRVLKARGWRDVDARRTTRE